MAMTHIFLIRAAFVEAWHVRRGEIRKLVVQKRGARRRGPRKSNLHLDRLRQVFARVRLPLNRVGLIWIEVRRCFADARPVRTCRVNVAELVLAAEARLCLNLQKKIKMLCLLVNRTSLDI